MQTPGQAGQGDYVAYKVTVNKVVGHCETSETLNSRENVIPKEPRMCAMWSW